MPPKKYPNETGNPNLGPDSAHDLLQITTHIENHFGEGNVFHEIASDYVHLYLHVVPATQNRPFHLIITSGMSDRPMKAPEAQADCKYAELYLALPPDWPLDKLSFKDEENWWPFRHLKQTARFPHVVDAWIWCMHTIGNEDPPEPFTKKAQFAGVMLYKPQLIPIEASNLKINEKKTIYFIPMIPLYESELRFAWEQGSEKLATVLGRQGVTELVDPVRLSVI